MTPIFGEKAANTAAPLLSLAAAARLALAPSVFLSSFSGVDKDG